ncbi:MAG: WG repeat-containing protein [Acidimicrobiales bacterium]
MGNKYGFIDRSGKMVINPQFDYADSFSEGLARVKLGNEFYKINKQGAILLDPTCVARP